MTLRYNMTMPPEDVIGLVVLETYQAPEGSGSQVPWMIQTIFSEFNSGAYLVDLGVLTPVCQYFG